MTRMDKPEFAAYPPTLGNAIADSAQRFGDQVFLASKGRRLTFAEVDHESLHLARGLLAAGVGKGTRVAILMGNSPDWVLAWFAAGRIGAFTVPVSTLFAPKELAWLLRAADIDTILMDDAYAGHSYLGRLEKAVPELSAQTSPELSMQSHPFLRRVVLWGAAGDRPWVWGGPADLIAGADARSGMDLALAEAAQENVAPADWLVGICTSGTSADPKIVIHSHGSVVRTTQGQFPYRSVTSDTHDLAVMPLFWVGGLNGHLLPCLYAGARLVFPETPATDDLVDAIVRDDVTRLNMMESRKKAIVDAGARRGVDLTGLEGVTPPLDSDGAVVPPPRRGGSMLGMTETFGPHGVQAVGSVLPESKVGSAGQSIEGIERRIVNRESGAQLQAGEVGDLHVRGYSLMQGYYKRERHEVFEPDGWFSSGDMCRIDDDDYIYFVDRLSDMIKTSGANVAPREVEVVLEAQPEIKEAIVVGTPDELRGEAVTAILVLNADAALDSEALVSRLREEISSYKVPTEFLVTTFDAVPRTQGGKPNRKALRARIPELRVG
jgi:acyl-CoA synthetase (AMP-forming)/AMP-acid ligase II